MSDIEKARIFFEDAGLGFPTIPERLSAELKEQGKWLFSTRELPMSPYELGHYINETDGPSEYAVLSHSGHGVNSYAIQYYLVSGPFRMFLHMAWGGIYMDNDAAASKIRKCFSLADEIVPAAMTMEKLSAGGPLMIVGTDFYESFWSAPGQHQLKDRLDSRRPVDILTEVLQWLKGSPSNKALD